MKLLYRGFYTEFKANRQPFSRQPSAINWRYQTEDNKAPSALKDNRIYKAPKALNWRWQY